MRAAAKGLGDVPKVEVQMVVSQNLEPQYRPQYTMILMMGTPIWGTPIIMGNPQIGCGVSMSRGLPKTLKVIFHQTDSEREICITAPEAQVPI